MSIPYARQATGPDVLLDGPQSPTRFLDVRDLRVHFRTDDGVVKSVDGLSFGLDRGRTLGIVGESGSGKSVTSLSIMGLNKLSYVDMSGEIWLDGQELVRASRSAVRALRGRKMAMIFQEPMTSLNPLHRIGRQIVEMIHLHRSMPQAKALARAVELLELV
ncbi:MAG TPA: ATP-binding cassette domain-containing protein, partial [Rugosimonospora sp.]|nr:ATP-binding cassette domain-containing protein [Rugosimonospora sp.]